MLLNPNDTASHTAQWICMLAVPTASFETTRLAETSRLRMFKAGSMSYLPRTDKVELHSQVCNENSLFKMHTIRFVKTQI